MGHYETQNILLKGQATSCPNDFIIFNDSNNYSLSMGSLNIYDQCLSAIKLFKQSYYMIFISYLICIFIINESYFWL